MGVIAAALLLAGAAPEPLRCFGTEPFWTFSVADGAARLERMGEAERRWPVEARAPAEGRLSPELIALGRGAAFAVLRREACSDAMSDATHPAALELILFDPPLLLTGCCRAS